MQFHLVAYIVNLNIEMPMAELIIKVAQLPNHAGPDASTSTRSGGVHISPSDLSASAGHRSWYKGMAEVKGEQNEGGQMWWSSGKPVPLDVVGDKRGKKVKRLLHLLLERVVGRSDLGPRRCRSRTRRHRSWHIWRKGDSLRQRR